jgi:hypothetical protein
MKKRKFIHKPVTNSKEAIQYLTELAFSDIQYHLDENANSIEWPVTKVSKEECLLLDQRNKECREVLVNDLFDFYFPMCMESSELKLQYK